MRFELTEEQMDIKQAVREFCEKEFEPELARKLDREEEFPWELYRKACKLGFIGIHFPEEYGGGGYGVLENCLVVEEMCRADSTLGTAIILGDFASEIILRFGTEEQKERYLSKVASGEWISAGAFTEPAHGSDLAACLDTRAVKEGDEWVINGVKTLITNAPIAHFFITLCQTDMEVEPPYRGQTLFIVGRETPGLDVTKIGDKMGIRASPTGEVSYSDVRVPESAVVGQLNKGFYHSLTFFDESRIEIAAQAVGIAQGALDRALRYAKEREAFGKPLVRHQAIAHKLAEMATKVEAARLLTYKAAWLIDQGKLDPALSSMAKTLAGRVAVEVCDEAVQILGGYGYIGDYDVERFYRDAKITEIYEGTREIQLNTITRWMLKR
ncbi:acyl-CoA dehydrogenase [Candidatus Bathyarchaeota archaeon ex4484_135]|nr:MAG: acyl-CoA dehydrogenase [Candidatus Bathyarchaeota archaeon ex4484_135]